MLREAPAAMSALCNVAAEPWLTTVMLLSNMLLLCQGAGSLFEALNAGKTVVAVPNALLMHNHQVSCCCIATFACWCLMDPLPQLHVGNV